MIRRHADGLLHERIKFVNNVIDSVNVQQYLRRKFLNE
jgi:hypothetical protein